MLRVPTGILRSSARTARDPGATGREVGALHEGRGSRGVRTAPGQCNPRLVQYTRAHTNTPYGLLVPHHQAPQRRSTNENSRWPPITCQDVMNQVCRPNTGAMRRIVALSACTPPDMSNVSPPARDSFHRLTQNPQNTATIAPSEHHRHFEVPHIKSHISPKKESDINQHK